MAFTETIAEIIQAQTLTSCRAATTGNITLSGNQTIDSAALIAGDRCLVRDQTDRTENGIYVVQDGAWTRASDMNGPTDIVSGAIVTVWDGSLYRSGLFQITFAGELSFGTTEIAATLLYGGDKSKQFIVVDTIAELQAQNGDDAEDTVLMLGARGGVFKWSTADESANVTADPGYIVYVPPTSDLTGASGCWVRVYGDHLEYEWAGPTTATATHLAYLSNGLAAQRVRNLAATLGVKLITSGPKTYTWTTDSVATGEGAVVRMTTGDRIKWEGRGTVIKPETNKIELFTVEGSTNDRFRGIIFDNSDNGALQNQTNTSANVPNTGVAGLGNRANSAIRQYTGGGLDIRHCEFKQFTQASHYIGDNDDDSVAVGDFRFLDNVVDGCVQGALVDSPERVWVHDNKYINGFDNVNADASTDDGHLLYLTDRDSGPPKTVSVSGNHSFGGQSSFCKIRKGLDVTVVGNVCNGTTRGIELWNCRGGSVSGNTISLWNIASQGAVFGSNHSCLEVTDCGEVAVGVNSFTLIGANGWGVRMRSGSSTETWANVGNTITGLTIANDYTGATGKAAILLDGQTAAVVNGGQLIHTGNTAATAYPVVLADCTDCRVIRFRHITTGSPSDADHIVNIDSDCSGCIIETSRHDIDTDWTATSVNDNGTNTTVIVDGEEEISTSSPVPTFATMGDAMLTVNGTPTLTAKRIGNEVFGHLDISFTTNAYTTASGALHISLPGLPVPTGSKSWPVDLWTQNNVTFSGELNAAVEANSGSARVKFRQVATGGSGSTITTSNVPASTTFGFEGKFNYDTEAA